MNRLIMAWVLTCSAFFHSFAFAQPHTLTLKDVKFEPNTGTIKAYQADYQVVMVESFTTETFG